MNTFTITIPDFDKFYTLVNKIKTYDTTVCGFCDGSGFKKDIRKQKVKNLMSHKQGRDILEYPSEKCPFCYGSKIQIWHSTSKGYKFFNVDGTSMWFYENTLTIREILNIPCAYCKLLPTKDGHDACLDTIPGCVGACCGHGVEFGYIGMQTIQESFYNIETPEEAILIANNIKKGQKININA